MIVRIIAFFFIIAQVVSAQHETDSTQCDSTFHISKFTYFQAQEALAGLPLSTGISVQSVDSAIPIIPTTYDSTKFYQETTLKLEDPDLIPLNEFTIAGDQRYTIDGSHPRRTNKLKPLTTALVGGTYFGTLFGLHIYQMNTIWNETVTFRYIEDSDQDLWSDKGGHFWGTYFVSYCSTEALLGSGFSVDNSMLYGGLMGFGYQLYVEIMDGYGKNWGFSTSDFIADFAGFAYYLGQHYVPFLQNFTPKATYFPAPWYGEKSRKEAAFL
ncbi:MAG: DUF2279 domain-containing protein [Ignavibacteria bacterium]|nr:DUF2279 domain-containing protein [Ignavibacteria bacterium]